jgi:transposase InsO family protein
MFQIFCQKIWAHHAHVFLVIVVGPFTKWGIDFTTCHPDSIRGHHYIIIAKYYFKKWFEYLLMFINDGETVALFIFNQIVARFCIPKDIVTDHGNHFQNKIMTELMSHIGFRKEHLSPYYPQANGQVEALNNSLKTILQRMINLVKSNWHVMLYSVLWAYQTSMKTATIFHLFNSYMGWKQSYLLSVIFLL